MSDQVGGEPAVMRYDAAPARRAWIVEELHRSGFLSITEIAARLGVSDMTVRRDLRSLSARHEVRVVHGGVSLAQGALRDPGYQARAADHADAKAVIAARAVSRIGDADTIAIDAGTTAYALARALPSAFRGTVVTHSVPVVNAFLQRGGVRVLGLGGDLLPKSQAFVGPMTVEAAASLRVRTFFMGAAAVDHRGVYVDADIERPTKSALMDTADQVVLLADAAKFTRTAPVRLCTLDRLSVLVTDADPPTGVRGAVEAAGGWVDVVDGVPGRRPSA